MSLTSANAVLQLSVPGLFDTAQQLQGFSSDDIFDVEAVRRAETLMGVDGYLSGGFVWEEVKQTITFQGDSPSINIIDQWDQAQLAQQDVYPAHMTVILTGVQTQWTCSNGYLMSWVVIPSAKKLIQPRRLMISWNNTSPAPYST